MPIVIACPSGHRLKVPTKYQGRRIVCPVCGDSIDVPGEVGSPKARRPSTPKKPVAPESPVASSPPTPKPAPPKPAPPKPAPPKPVDQAPTASTVARDLNPTPEPEVPEAAPPHPVSPKSEPPKQTQPAEPTCSSEPPEIAAPQLETTPERIAPNEPVPPAPSISASQPAPLNMPLPDMPDVLELASPDGPPSVFPSEVPSELLFGEDAIEAASMLAAEENNLFPEIRIDTEQVVEVDARHATKSADPAQARFQSVLMLAIASILVAAFCLIPSIIEQTVARRVGMRQPDAWSYAVILLATVQIAISIYSIRIPDWTTVWVVAVVSTTLAAVYAAGLALTMFAGQDHSLVRQLGLLDEVFRYRAQPWCFLTMCILLTLAFCCGKYSVGWRQSEIRLAESQAAA